MKDILILADETTVELEAGASLSNMQVVFENKTSMVETWDKFTEDNLKVVQITDENGSVIAEYNDLVLSSVASTEQEDGTVLTTFILRQKSEVEVLKEQTKQQADSIKMLTACVLEMSEAVYA